jgi:molybdopterin molybdotransferase
VRGASVSNPVRLQVVATVAAGMRAERAVAVGEAMRIMTGAPVPPGADTVIRVEDTDAGTTRVSITDDRDLTRNIRRRGEDVVADRQVIARGVQLSAAHIGVLSSVGCSTPWVHLRPRVGILATGDEIVPVEQFDRVLAGDRIVSSNSYSLAAAVQAAGGHPVSLGIAPDDPARLADHLRKAERCDLVLTSGGVSVGDFDFTRRVVTELGGTLSMWRVKMRPGAPLGFGTIFGLPWLGLPGNPVSALVTFELFGRPLVRTLGGNLRPHRRTARAIVGEPIVLGAPLTHFLRVVLDDSANAALPVARLTGAQSSGMLTSMSAADALLIVPPEPQDVAAGTVLRIIPLDGDLGGSAHFLA